MPTNKETKLSLKEKLYQETLDELVTKVWKYKYMPSWSKFIEYVGEGGSRQKDIEKAVKLAIKKTYDALQDGQLTEVGQTLFDRRKDIEAHTANRIFAELDLRLITKLHKVSDLKKDNPDTIWCIKEKDYNAIKKQHGVKVY